MVKKERMLLTLMTLGVSLMLILRDIAGIAISKYLYLGFITAFMAIASYGTLVYMLCFVFPLLCGLPGTYIMPCALLLLLIKKGKVGAPLAIAVITIALMELFSSLWYTSFSFATYVQYVSFAIVMFAFIYEVSDVDYMFCTKMYFYGVCLLCGVIIINALNTAPSNWLSLFAKGHFRIGETHMKDIEGMALSLNANSLAYYSITGITCGTLLIEQGGKKERLRNILLTMLTGAAGFLTISRSWLLVAGLCTVLYVASRMGGVKKGLQMLFVVTIVVVIAFAFFNENPHLLAGFITRMTRDDVRGGNGRVEVALMYLERMVENPRVFFCWYRSYGISNIIGNGYICPQRDNSSAGVLWIPWRKRVFVWTDCAII